MSEYKFKIIYRNENEYGQYWGDNRYAVSIIAETLEQAKQKLDEIEKNNYGMHKNILKWEAEEITEEKDKEIERLNNIINELEKEINKRITFIKNYGANFGLTIPIEVSNEIDNKLDELNYCLRTLKKLKGDSSNE